MPKSDAPGGIGLDNVCEPCGRRGAALQDAFVVCI